MILVNNEGASEYENKYGAVYWPKGQYRLNQFSVMITDGLCYLANSLAKVSAMSSTHGTRPVSYRFPAGRIPPPAAAPANAHVWINATKNSDSIFANGSLKKAIRFSRAF